MFEKRTFQIEVEPFSVVNARVTIFRPDGQGPRVAGEVDYVRTRRAPKQYVATGVNAGEVGAFSSVDEAAFALALAEFNHDTKNRIVAAVGASS